MNMKKITLLLLLFCSIHSIGQEKLNIDIDNPAPRVGQPVTFSINMDFLTDYFKKQIGKNVNFKGASSIFRIQSDDFERVIKFEKAKNYTIGPFNFEFNNKKYTTDVIEVTVSPELPMQNGLWLRITEFDGQKYLILEQLISNQSNKTQNENGGYTQTIGGILPEGKEFAELNKEVTQGILLNNYSSASNTITPDGGNPLDAGFSYSIKKYKITFDDTYNGEYTITEKNFKDLPEVFDIQNVKLKK